MTTCPGPDPIDPETRQQNREFEALLMEFNPQNYSSDFEEDCRTGFESDCPPEVQLGNRLRSLGPNLVNWLTDLGATTFAAIKEAARDLAVKTTVVAAMALPVVIAGPEVAAAITIEEGAMEHVALRHFWGSAPLRASKFLPGYSTQKGIVSLATIAAKVQPVVVSYVARNGTLQTAQIRVIELTETVGFDFANSNAPTRFFTVWSNLAGKLATMHPGLPSSTWPRKP